MVSGIPCWNWPIADRAERHLKCRDIKNHPSHLLTRTGDLDDLGCGNCQQAGVDCDRSNIRFRNGLSLPEEPELAFPDQASWPHVHGRGMLSDFLFPGSSNVVVAVRFHNETAEIASLYSTEDQPTFLESIVFEAPEVIGDSLYTNASSALYPLTSAVASHSSSVSSWSSPSTQSRASSKVRHPLSEREAILMRNFVENMALWVCIFEQQL